MKFTRLTNEADVSSLIQFHNHNSEALTIDVETSSVDPRTCNLIDIQIPGYEEDSAFIFSAEYRHLLKDLSKSLTLVAHNYKFDAHVLFKHGIDLLGYTWRDTLLLSHLQDENRESYSLDSFVKEIEGSAYKSNFWEKYKTYEEAPEEDKLDYACRDVVYTQRLYAKVTADLHAGGVPESLIEHVHRLQRALLETEIQGIKIDREYLINLGVGIKAKLDQIKPKMLDLVRPEVELVEMDLWQKEIAKYKTDKRKSAVEKPVFNFESSRQLQSLLFEHLALPVQRNEKTKQISTDYASLEKIKEAHPVVGLIQDNRELEKVYTAYIQGTLERAGEDDVIYPEFRVSGTKTGRISHNNPNLGQLPKTGGIRGIYVPRPGYVFISADYSQLEVCIEANLTDDVQLARIFREGLSKHDITATELSVDRDTAKTLNFALQFWASHFKVAKLLGVSENEGKKIWDNYWNLYQGPKRLKEFTDRAVNGGENIITAFGRVRRFPIRRRAVWDGDYRQAYNFLIQGTGADLTSRAFYLTSEWLKEKGIGRGLLTVHDELIIEVNKNYAPEAEAKMLQFMVLAGNEINLKIPLSAQSSGPMERWED